jgi:Fe-S-cluster containining protein
MPAPDPFAAHKSEALAKVKKIYGDLAQKPLERDCRLRTECCKFHLTGKIPHLTRGEALLAAKALRAAGRKSLPERADGACPLLEPSTARCLIYEARPFGCRTHFCAAAGGPYPRARVLDLIHRLEDIDKELGGDGPHPLRPAILEALDDV